MAQSESNHKVQGTKEVKSPAPTDFSKAVRSFLTYYLPNQRGLSHNTVLSYKDTLKLLVKFMVDEKKIDLKTFTFKDFTKSLVDDFLEYYKSSGASPSAVNQRLGAIKSFGSYLGYISTEELPELVLIKDIELLRPEAKPIQFLSPEQIDELLNEPNIRRRIGVRHKAILALLYDSGCRVQELCDLTVGDVDLGNEQATVKIHGRDGKPRTVTISEETTKTLKDYHGRYLKRAVKADPFLTNRQGGKMNWDGITYIVQKYAFKAAEKNPAFPPKVHCQMLRHSKAMHMLRAGVDIETIREFLGHSSLSTTLVYAKTNNLTKEPGTEELPPEKPPKEPQAEQPKDPNLMDFLKDFR